MYSTASVPCRHTAFPCKNLWSRRFRSELSKSWTEFITTARAQGPAIPVDVLAGRQLATEFGGICWQREERERSGGWDACWFSQAVAWWCRVVLLDQRTADNLVCHSFMQELACRQRASEASSDVVQGRRWSLRLRPWRRKERPRHVMLIA